MARETDGDWITLVASNLPANATFTSASGTGAVSNQFSFSPSSNQAGQAYAVVFYAGEADGTNSRTLDITVPSHDPWADYYASCYTNGALKTGVDLKNALHNIIDGHMSYSYAATENILKDIDECPTNSAMVQLLYLQYGRAKSNFGTGGGQWNREHVWANSHGIDDSLPAYSDVHHLHPTDVTVNSTRGDKDFDVVDGTSNSFSYSTDTFEPPDAGKGDVARAMFYMAVRYDGSDGVSNLELTNAIPTSTSGALHGKLDTLLDWNELDSVNAYEIRRNDLVHANWQHNRNPFVDHPEWARAVFDTNYVSAPPPPPAFAATPNGSGQIDLTFTLNGSSDDVIIVWDGDGSFSDPSGTAPAVGQPFAGGTVLYKGDTSPQSHAGLTNCQAVFYACWSFSGTNYSEAGQMDSAVAPGPDAPVQVWASATNATDFTAAWSAVAGATGYRLDVATNSSFSDAGAGRTLIDEDFADLADWTNFGTSTDEVEGHYGAASPCRALVNGNTLTSSGVDYPTQMLFFADASSAGNGKTTTNYYSLDSGGNWMPLGTFTVSSDGGTVTQALTSAPNLSGSTNVRFRFVSAFSTWYLDDVEVTGGQLEEPSYVAGYSNLPVSGTSQAVSGLETNTTYYFRVASEPNCAGGYSFIASATTLEAQPEDQTIAFPAIGAQLATNVLALSATASSGLPISFAVGSGPATISSGTTLAFTGAGTVAIVASQAGDASWNPAPNVTNVIAVTKATAGVTLGSLSQTYDGTPKSATATTVPAGLSVDFTYDGSATAPTAEGSYAVTGAVNEALYSGEAVGTLVISVEALTPFQLWVRDDQGQNVGDPDFAADADFDGDGATTYEEYLADTDPTSPGSVLALTGQYFIVSASNAAGKIRMSFPASTSRFYQLVYSTNLANPPLTTDLGWGAVGMAITNNGAGTWYGRIRSLLTVP